jgi:stage IV sporulation protein B
MRKPAYRLFVYFLTALLLASVVSSRPYSAEEDRYAGFIPDGYPFCGYYQSHKTEGGADEGLLSGYEFQSAAGQSSAAAQSASAPFLQKFFKRAKPDKRAAQTPETVFVGGIPVGLTLRSKGVIVLGIGNVRTAEGTVRPFAGKSVREGDIIVRIGGTEVNNAADVNEVLNRPELRGTEIEVCFVRKGKTMYERVTPVLDTATERYKLGLWIRDTAAGVGTLTFVKPNLRFGALGHPICDADMGDVMPINGGNVYGCDIVGVVRGQKGSAGELRGVFLRNRRRIGTLDKNNKFGIFGTLDGFQPNPLYPEAIKCGGKGTAHPGAASIVATVGDSAGEYAVEIIKTNYQSAEKEKSMVLRVTDEELLRKTGGIVQGMSGSPIIQDGKLIGAVTHVFINDPTKGFGVYIDWMINQ